MYKKKIVSVIVTGNLELDNESFEECNHVWLLIFYRGTAGGIIFIVEPTSGETDFIDSVESELLTYLHGYYYLSPSDLRADAKERW